MAGCYGAWHGDCFEYHPSESHLLIKCLRVETRCRCRQHPPIFGGSSTRKTWTWRRRGRLHQILLDQAQSLPRSLQDDFLAGYGCVLPKDDRKRKAAVLIPAPSQRYWPPPPPQQARAIGGGWWAKPDVTPGRAPTSTRRRASAPGTRRGGYVSWGGGGGVGASIAVCTAAYCKIGDSRPAMPASPATIQFEGLPSPGAASRASWKSR